MGKRKRLEVYRSMIDVGFIPLFYNDDIDIAIKVVGACLEGGAHCIEFTNRGENAQKVFGGLVEHFKDDDRLILGAGSVVDAGTASIYMQMDAEFIVGPILSEEVMYTCNRRKAAYVPGCGTLNEISYAEKLGAEICKVFPGSTIGGPKFIKSVLAPMPWCSLMPTGGVTTEKENILEWFEAGVVCVGIGSKLINNQVISSENYQKITEDVKRVKTIISEYRAQKS